MTSGAIAIAIIFSTKYLWRHGCTFYFGAPLWMLDFDLWFLPFALGYTHCEILGVCSCYTSANWAKYPELQYAFYMTKTVDGT